MTSDKLIRYVAVALIAIVVIQSIVIITMRRKPVVEFKPVPVYIDRSDTIRIETIKSYINNYTREPERIYIYQADAVQLDSILAAQLVEIAKRGW